MKCKTFTFILLTLFSIGVCAQNELCDQLNEDESFAHAKELVEQLDQGVLAIRVYSHRRKIEVLQDLVDGGRISEERAGKLKKKIQEIKEERNQFVRLLQQAFESNYSSSEVVFYWDKDHDKILEGRSDLWLSKEIAYQKNEIDINDIVLFLLEGRTEETSIEAFLVRDRHGEEVCYPLPRYFKKNRIADVLSSREKALKKLSNKMAAALQQRLAYIRQSGEEYVKPGFWERLRAWLGGY